MRYLWASPTTLLGLLALAIDAAGGPLAGGHRGGRRRVRMVSGVIEAHGPVLAWGLAHLTLVPGGVAAMTLGHIVVARSARDLDATRTHERVHVRQYERWGPFFLPAYACASLVAVLRGGHFYRDNAFEVEAYAAERQKSAAPGGS